MPETGDPLSDRAPPTPRRLPRQQLWVKPPDPNYKPWQTQGWLVPRGEKVLYSETDPESYITVCTLVHEETPNLVYEETPVLL